MSFSETLSNTHKPYSSTVKDQKEERERERERRGEPSRKKNLQQLENWRKKRIGGRERPSKVQLFLQTPWKHSSNRFFWKPTIRLKSNFLYFIKFQTISSSPTWYTFAVSNSYENEDTNSSAPNSSLILQIFSYDEE